MKIDTKSLNITDNFNFFFLFGFSPYSSDFELLDGTHNLFILVFLWFCTQELHSMFVKWIIYQGEQHRVGLRVAAFLSQCFSNSKQHNTEFCRGTSGAAKISNEGITESELLAFILL